MVFIKFKNIDLLMKKKIEQNGRHFTVNCYKSFKLSVAVISIINISAIFSLLRLIRVTKASKMK